MGEVAALSAEESPQTILAKLKLQILSTDIAEPHWAALTDEPREDRKPEGVITS